MYQNRIKQLRLENGLTVEQLAADIGISVEEMIMYEDRLIAFRLAPQEDNHSEAEKDL